MLRRQQSHRCGMMVHLRREQRSNSWCNCHTRLSRLRPLHWQHCMLRLLLVVLVVVVVVLVAVASPCRQLPLLHPQRRRRPFIPILATSTPT